MNKRADVTPVRSVGSSGYDADRRPDPTPNDSVSHIRYYAAIGETDSPNLDNAKPTLMIHFTQLKLYSGWPKVRLAVVHQLAP